MIVYLLPLLIANQGGRIVYGERGGVVASIATMGVIVGSTIPMFLGAMIVGPLAAWLMKKIDSIWDGKIRPGLRDARQHVLGRHPRHGSGDPVVLRDRTVRDERQLVARLRCPVARRRAPAAADEHHRRAREGALPQQRDRQRHARPARHPAVRRHRPVAAVPRRGEPRARLRPAARVHALRDRGRERVGARRDHHPVLRRHPRGVLPLRADEACAHHRPHRRWGDRSRHQRGLRQRPARTCCARQHHRGARPDAEGQLRRCHPLGGALGRCDVPDQRGDPAGLAQA